MLELVNNRTTNEINILDFIIFFPSLTATTAVFVQNLYVYASNHWTQILGHGIVDQNVKNMNKYTHFLCNSAKKLLIRITWDIKVRLFSQLNIKIECSYFKQNFLQQMWLCIAGKTQPDKTTSIVAAFHSDTPFPQKWQSTCWLAGIFHGDTKT